MFVDSLALTLTNGFTWIPLYLAFFYLVIKNNEKWGQIFLIIGASALCLLLADGLSEGIMKPYVARLRPSFDPSLFDSVQLVKGYTANGYSFFSAHAANTFSLALFFSLLVRNRVFSTFLILWSLVNCWTRLYLGVHFPIDILVGLVWGAVVGLLVYILFMKAYVRITPKLHYISTQYTKTGYSLTDIDIVLNILVLTCIYAIVKAVVIAM